MTGREETYAVERIPPSERVRKEIDELLAGKTKGKSQDEREQSLLILAMKRILQEAVEREQAEFLGRKHYEHQNAGHGWRNGYEPKTFRTTVGKVPLEVPQTRDTDEPFRSKLLDGLKGRTDALERMATEMYARGLSVRDVEAVFESATGEQLLSRSVVSEVTESLNEEFAAFQGHDLADYDLECLFLDAIYEALRLRAGIKEAVLCAWGVLRDGRKVLLHMTLGNKESYEAWLEMLRNMVNRHLRLPLTVTADGAPGLIKAIDQMYPKSLRIRCWVHKMRNIRAKLPREVVRRERDMGYTLLSGHGLQSVLPGDRFSGDGQRLILPFFNSNPLTTRSQNHTCQRFSLTSCSPTPILPSASLKFTHWPRKCIHPSSCTRRFSKPAG
jgi:transposase-like protein